MKSDLEKSLKDRIRNLARAENKDPAVIWQSILFERFLVRVARSSYANRFVLKGGVLLTKVLDIGRETKDLDFSLPWETLEVDRAEEIIREITEIDLRDGFSYRDVKAQTLAHPQMKYPGVRVKMKGYFGRTRFLTVIDMGFMDLVEPTTQKLSLTASKKGAFFEDNVEVICFPLEYVFAEKVHAIIQHGRFNSRMKDFHDLYMMISIRGGELKNGLKFVIEKVFEHRGATITIPFRYSPQGFSELESRWVAHIAGLKIE